MYECWYVLFDSITHQGRNLMMLTLIVGKIKTSETTQEGFHSDETTIRVFKLFLVDFPKVT